jgi:hypothetical protein
VDYRKDALLADYCWERYDGYVTSLAFSLILIMILIQGSTIFFPADLENIPVIEQNE